MNNNDKSLKKYFEGFAPLYREANYEELKPGFSICLFFFLVVFFPIGWFVRDLLYQRNVNYIALIIIVSLIFFFGHFIINGAIHEGRIMGRAEARRDAYLENVKREAETNPEAKDFIDMINKLEANKKMDSFFRGEPWKILLEDEK